MTQVESLLNELKKPLRQRILERVHGIQNDHTPSYGFTQNGVGLAITEQNAVQIGGIGAHISYQPEQSCVVQQAKQTQIHGQLSLFPSGGHETIDINNGPLNAALIPPKEITQRDTPTYALATVKTSPSQRTNTATPSDTVHVVIPDHTHIVVTELGPVESQTATWLSDGPKAEVHGLTYQYLFGYNHISEQTERKIADLLKESKT